MAERRKIYNGCLRGCNVQSDLHPDCSSGCIYFKIGDKVKQKAGSDIGTVFYIEHFTLHSTSYHNFVRIQGRKEDGRLFFIFASLIEHVEEMNDIKFFKVDV